MIERTLTQRLAHIEQLETELLKRVSSILGGGEPMFMVDLFLFGATSRTHAQSRGFRALVLSRNFPSATVLLRTQIDTAMRINGLTTLASIEESLRRVMAGEVLFSQLEATDGKRLTDAFLREQLAVAYPWVDAVYKQASDFVHLSFRHLFTSLTATHDTGIGERSFEGVIGSDESHRTESDYFEVCDAFIEASTMTCTIILGMFMLVHRPAEVRVAAEE